MLILIMALGLISPMSSQDYSYHSLRWQLEGYEGNVYLNDSLYLSDSEWVLEVDTLYRIWEGEVSDKFLVIHWDEWVDGEWSRTNAKVMSLFDTSVIGDIRLSYNETYNWLWLSDRTSPDYNIHYEISLKIDRKVNSYHKYN